MPLGYWPERLKLGSFGDLPYVFPEIHTGQKIVRTLLEGMLGKEMRDSGFEPVSACIAGPRQITLGKPIVDSLDDLKGLKFRAIGWEAKTLEALGATGLAVPAAEGAPSVLSGVLDGITMVYWGIEPWGMLDVVNEIVETGGHQYTLLMLGVNPKTWNSLPEDIQELMIEVAAEAEVNFVEAQIRLDDEWRQYFIDKGAKVLILPPEEVQRAKEITAPVIDEWLEARGEIGEVFWSEYSALLSAYSPK